MIERYNQWQNNILQAIKLSEKIFIYLPECGLGDRISCLPAFRALKKLNKDKKIYLITVENGKNLFDLCKYIDGVIPVEMLKNGLDSIILRDRDSGKICDWTFFEHHQQHVVKSALKYIAGVNPSEADKYDLTYEFTLKDYQLEQAEKLKNELLEKANGKKLIGIAPANTMLSRMWPLEYWNKLVSILKNDFNYFVVSFVGSNDLKVSGVDYDKSVNFAITPKILDIFENLITVGSGMLHVGSVNQNVKMTLINVGQYPEKIILPFRKTNDIYYNRIVINHNCEYKQKCFEGHITNREITKQMNEYSKEYLIDSGKIFPNEQYRLLQKYTCWFYCYKDRNKYSCTKQITPEMVVEKIN